MAENRLFQMLYILLEKGKSTAPELADRFEVSVRTIYRDIDILSSAGIPVYTTQGKGGGIFIEENYVLDKSLISEQEQNQILMALQGLSIIAEENTNELLSKLGGVFQKQSINWLEVDFSEWNRKSEEVFRTLKSAIFHKKVVCFTYFNSKGESGNRSAEPLKLVFKSGQWYLYAYCRLRDDFRLFKLIRVKELLITEESFIRTVPKKVFEDMNPYSEQEVTVSLLFHHESAYRVFENFDEIEENEDGSYFVKIAIPDNEFLYGFLLSFGDKVEVLEPAVIRDNLIKRIDSMKNKYKT